MPTTVQPAFTLSGDTIDAHVARAAFRAQCARLGNIVADLKRQAKDKVHVEPELARYQGELARVRRMLAELDAAPRRPVPEVVA